MKSREDLVGLALSIVGGDGGSGQAPEAEDEEFVNDLVGPVFSSLSKRNIYPYGDADQIEDEAYIHLAICLANSEPVTRRFGVAIDKEAVFSAERDLRLITAETLSYQPQQAEYF